MTTRPCSPGLEPLLNVTYPILDHGFLRVEDYMGTDASITEAARMSTGSQPRSEADERGLLNYLMRHGHTSPFEMCEIRYRVKVPIFVARQWVRHRTANMNEYSMRYRPAITDVYLPAPENLARQDTENKQGRGKLLTSEEADSFLDTLEASCDIAKEDYQVAIADYDLAKELARIGLTLNTYTEFTWKTDLHNLFGFLHQRAGRHAQYEIRVYAEKMLEITKAWVPWAYAAFEEHRRGAFLLSKTMINVVRHVLESNELQIKGADIDWLGNTFGGLALTKRERAELSSALGGTE
jgi:thymidylate synthase (FAD)